MKKVIPILLCVLLIGMLAFSVSAEGSSVAITPSKTTLERGDTFTIVANLTNTDAINTGVVALTYNESVFEMTGGSCDIAGAVFGQVGVSDKAGVFMLGAPQEVSGKIFTFNFKVKTDAAFGTYTFDTTASIGISTGSKISATGTTVTIACEHKYGEWTKVDDNQHQRICSKCQNPQVEDHDWNDGIANPAPGCETPGNIDYTCLFCDATKSEKLDPIGHKYDNECDTTCNNNCGTTRDASHKYATTYSSDKNGHWYACSNCGEKKDEAKHTPGPAATENSAQLCTVCNYEIAPILPHEHDISDEWMSDAQYHWYRCTKKGCYYTEQKARHIYDDDCDVSCSACNYIRNDAPHSYRPELQANAEGHWQVCANCEAKSEVVAHVPGPEATETEPQLCTECNFRIKMPLSHEHDYGDIWYSDNDCHWQSCVECTEATPTEDHVWDEGEELEDGRIRYTCSICTKELILSQPMGSEPETQPTTPPTAQKPGQEEKKGGFPWQWAGIAAIVLMIVGVVLLVVEFVRSRKTNMHGKFSK